MRVLVTGGAGFIGSAVCRHFILDLDHEVVVVDKLTYAGNLASLAPVAANPQYVFEKHDICDVDAVNEIFAKYRPDAVVHLAAESHVDRSITGATFSSRPMFRDLHAARGRAQLSGRRPQRLGATSVSCMSRPTRSMARSATTVCSPRRRPTIQVRPIRPPRRLRIISPRRGSEPMACRSSSRTARTITAPIIFPKS